MTNPLNLTELAAEVHAGNKKRGFYDTPRENGTMLMLVVSELGEAIEADRKGRYALTDDVTEALSISNETAFQNYFRNYIKDTYEDELADALIRILDHAGALGIDIHSHVAAKLRFNSCREQRHGKAY